MFEVHAGRGIIELLAPSKARKWRKSVLSDAKAARKRVHEVHDFTVLLWSPSPRVIHR
jgi:hypothetical protein